MSAAALPDGRPRSRRGSVGRVAATLWGPCLLPLLCGQLGGSGYALATYGKLLPVVPGAIVGTLFRQSVWTFAAAAAAPTALAFLALYLACRELPSKLLWGLQAAVVILVAIESFAFVWALRT